jgi:Domain of unknown function (DUF6969)
MLAAEQQDRLIARLRQLPRDELLAMYDAAAEATECAVQLAQSGTNPVTEVLGGAGTVEEWQHFPPDDITDPATHSLFYYHSHAAAERVAGEHGHFHTFVRPKEIEPALKPAAQSQQSEDAGGIAHLVGISTDASGRLIRLFTTNRWVTGEVWYGAEAMIGLLERFDITVETPSAALNRWVKGIVRMFRPQIADLIRARDAAVANFARAHPGDDVYEDRALQVTSEIDVDFLAQIRAIEAALTAH